MDGYGARRGYLNPAAGGEQETTEEGASRCHWERGRLACKSLADAMNYPAE
jgi:hypothetical protein